MPGHTLSAQPVWLAMSMEPLRPLWNPEVPMISDPLWRFGPSSAHRPVTTSRSPRRSRGITLSTAKKRNLRRSLQFILETERGFASLDRKTGGIY